MKELVCLVVRRAGVDSAADRDDDIVEDLAGERSEMSSLPFDAGPQIASMCSSSGRTATLTKPWWMARKAVNAGGLQTSHRQGLAACSSAPPPVPAVMWTTCACGFVRS